LSRRFAESVEVLARPATSLEPDHSELALRLQAAAVVPAMNDASTAASLARRLEPLRKRAADPAAPPDLLAAVAFAAILTNEASEVGANLATRALEIGAHAWVTGGRPWFSFATWFSRATLSRFWAERYAEVQP